MSRSNPVDIIPNPATRWFEWDGGQGGLKFYNKEIQATQRVGLPFDFILLDRLATIKGWHDASESGIYSNEVRDTRSDPMLVKAFKMKEPIAEGFYSSIKDRVKAEGGRFTLNCYIAYTDDSGGLSLGSLRFHGAALSAWMEFENDKENRPLIYKNGIQIVEAKKGKKGGITFQVPVFKLLELPLDVNDKAAEIDRDILQPYLNNYFKRPKHKQVEEDDDRTDYSAEYNQDPRPHRSVGMDEPSSDEEEEIPF